MATIVFPKLKIICGLKIFQETGPLGPKLLHRTCSYIFIIYLYLYQNPNMHTAIILVYMEAWYLVHITLNPI